MYRAIVAPPIAAHPAAGAPARALAPVPQRYHWYTYEIPLFGVQVPDLAVSARPIRTVPLIVGILVAVGAAGGASTKALVGL